MNVGDWSGNQWVSMFSSEAEKVLGVTAQEAGDLFEQDPTQFNELVEKAHFKQFVLKCRAKTEVYNVSFDHLSLNFYIIDLFFTRTNNA